MVPTHRFGVAVVHPDLGAPADLDELLDRREQGFARTPDVSGEHPVRFPQRAGESEEFFGGAEHSRRIDEPAGKTTGALFQALFQGPRHRRPLPTVRRPRPKSHRPEAQEAVGNERRHVERQPAGLQRRKVVGERRPPPGSALRCHPGVHRRGEVPGFPEERRRSEPAVPDHLGGDALGQPAREKRVPIRSAAREQQIAMGMDVHETGSGDEAVSVNFAKRLSLGRDKAAVADSEVPAPRRRPGTVHDQCVPDPVVERGGVRRTRLAASRAEETGGEGAAELPPVHFTHRAPALRGPTRGPKATESSPSLV